MSWPWGQHTGQFLGTPGFTDERSRHSISPAVNSSRWLIGKRWYFTRLRVPFQLGGWILYFLAGTKAQAPEGSQCNPPPPFTVSKIPYVLQYLGYIYTWDLPSITTALQCESKRSSSSDALKDSLTSESKWGTWMRFQSFTGGGDKVKVYRQQPISYLIKIKNSVSFSKLNAWRVSVVESLVYKSGFKD